jgi:superfamily II DNA helicase RecQ
VQESASHCKVPLISNSTHAKLGFTKQVKRKAWAGEYQMLYITPELATNNTAALQQLHATRGIGLIAIDEAHCVSEW